MSQYRLQSRGGKGIRNYYVDKNGPVAGVRMVDEDDDVIIITDDGVIIRIPVREITVQSRYGGGVRAMRVSEESRVVTLARAPKEEPSEDEGQEETQNSRGEEAAGETAETTEKTTED